MNGKASELPDEAKRVSKVCLKKPLLQSWGLEISPSPTLSWKLSHEIRGSSQFFHFKRVTTYS